MAILQLTRMQSRRDQSTKMARSDTVAGHVLYRTVHAAGLIHRAHSPALDLAMVLLSDWALELRRLCRSHLLLQAPASAQRGWVDYNGYRKANRLRWSLLVYWRRYTISGGTTSRRLPIPVDKR